MEPSAFRAVGGLPDERDSVIRVGEVAWLVTWAALALAAPPSSAADSATSTSPPVTVELRDAIALALRHAFPARIASEREAAARARVGEARTAFLPDLSASVAGNAYQRMLNPDYVYGAGIDDEELSGEAFDADLTASYVLLSSTRRLDLKAATLGLARSSAANETARRQVVRDVARAYLRVVEADAVLHLARQDLLRREQHRNESRALIAAGKRADYELIRAEAGVAASEASRVEASNGARVARSTLMQVIGHELPADFAIASPPPPVDPRAGRAADELVRSALARRADLRAAEVDAAAVRVDRARVDRRFLPTLSLYARYNRVLDASRFDAFDRSTSYGGRLDVQFSDLFTNAYRAKGARAEVRAAEIAADQTKVAISLDLERALLDVDRAAELMAALDKSRQAARRNYESTAERYRLGVATQTERIDAEVALAEAELDAAKADVGHRIANWNLRYEMGEPLETE